jgi:hypothetical protein
MPANMPSQAVANILRAPLFSFGMPSLLDTTGPPFHPESVIVDVIAEAYNAKYDAKIEKMSEEEKGKIADALEKFDTTPLGAVPGDEAAAGLNASALKRALFKKTTVDGIENGDEDVVETEAGSIAAAHGVAAGTNRHGKDRDWIDGLLVEAAAVGREDVETGGQGV